MIRTVRARWLNSTVLGIGMASLFSDLSHEVVTSLLPSLLASMGAAVGVLGTIEAVSDGLSSLAKLYGGWWTDRLNRRKPLCAAGYGTMAAAIIVLVHETKNRTPTFHPLFASLRGLPARFILFLRPAAK